MCGITVAQSRSTYEPGGSARSAIKGKRRSAIREQIYAKAKPLQKKEKINELCFTILIRDAVNIDKSMRGATDTMMNDILHPHFSGEVENP